jgi:hypothetical protein
MPFQSLRPHGRIRQKVVTRAIGDDSYFDLSIGLRCSTTAPVLPLTVPLI